MPAVSIAITHEQEQAIAAVVAQLRDPFTGQPMLLDHVFAALVDDLVSLASAPERDDARRARTWLQAAGLLVASSLIYAGSEQ